MATRFSSSATESVPADITSWFITYGSSYTDETSKPLQTRAWLIHPSNATSYREEGIECGASRDGKGLGRAQQGPE